jgi:hypothetical protein
METDLPRRNEPRTVAALYVDRSGPYFSRPGVDAWDVARDAKGYAGPYPVVAHPPCGPWGAYRWACRLQDPELARIAVRQVQQFGGVLEHPAGSLLWRDQGLWEPGEWTDEHGGWSIQVDQVRWGHKARKRTWLYLVGIPRELRLEIPPPRVATHIIGGYSRRAHPDLEARGPRKPCLWSTAARLTPPDFAEWLVSLARLARRD